MSTNNADLDTRLVVKNYTLKAQILFLASLGLRLLIKNFLLILVSGIVVLNLIMDLEKKHWKIKNIVRCEKFVISQISLYLNQKKLFFHFHE